MPKAPQRAQQRAPHVAPPHCQRRQCLRFQRIQALEQHKHCTQTPHPRQASHVIEARFKDRHRPQTYTRSSLGGIAIARRMGGTLLRTARWSGPESVCKQPAARPAHALRTDVRKPAGRVVCYHTKDCGARSWLQLRQAVQAPCPTERSAGRSACNLGRRNSLQLATP